MHEQTINQEPFSKYLQEPHRKTWQYLNYHTHSNVYRKASAKLAVESFSESPPLEQSPTETDEGVPCWEK